MSSGLIDHVRELAETVGGLRFRRMFGGWGVFCEAGMCGIVSGDVLFLKIDEASVGRFEAEGLEPFSYATKKGRQTIDTYRRAPERSLDDPDEFAEWMRLAVDATARKAEAKASKGRAGSPRRGGRLAGPPL
ncbi:TfoX/Sxy family protein [Prosthecomicrobium sp. N25]|uniref:TfoX/Sxy family protein n=1 Tax=Prosthecomicrobium sp. N25 TaxID=3129254 RepID=UPI003077E97F